MSSTLVLNLAYIALLGSTLTRTLNWLRIMLILGSVAFVAYGAVVGIRSMVIWNIVIGGMHLYQMVREFLAKRDVVLTAEECALRDELFPTLSDFDFNVVWRLGDQRAFTDETIIEEGSTPDFVGVVLTGVARVSRVGHPDRGIRRGGLLGEMSFVSGHVANATVTVSDTLVMHAWSHRELSSLDQVHPHGARSFRELISRDLAAKARA